MVETDKAIEVRGLRVKYRSSNEWILRGVDLDVYPNKTALILGKSGSGKTTLVRALTGVAKNVYGADVNGVVKVLGRDLNSYNVDEIRRVIQVVNQNPYADFMSLYVNEDIDGVIRFNKVDPKYVDNVFKLFKVEGLLDRNLFELSGGQLKRLAIVKALMFNPAILILDEPLMWLDDFGVESVVESIKMLKILGKTIVVFEHRFKPLMNIVDEIYVIKDGVIKTVDTSFLNKSGMQSRFSGNRHGFERIGREKVLEIKDLWFKYVDEWILRGLNLVVNQGDAVIIYGRNGSGKSTLLKILAGYLKPKKGIIRISKRVVYVPQNIYLFYTEETLENEIKSMCASSRSRAKCVDAMVNTIAKDLDLNRVDLSRTPFSLSWGEAIRFAISLSCALDPDTIVMLDEPFTGLTYYERLLLARYLAKLGITIVIATSNRDIIEYMYSNNLNLRVFTMDEGQLKEVQLYSELYSESDAVSFAYLVKDVLFGDRG